MPRVFYFAYDHQTPTGGQKSVYRHVDILNAHGIEAYVLHLKQGMKLNWFDHDTRIIHAQRISELFHPRKDFIVLPEDLGSKILSFPGQKVILNQNVYLGFSCFGMTTPPTYPYLNRDVKAVIVKSAQNEAQLRFAFPNLTYHHVVNGIDPTLNIYRPIADKLPRISILPAKNRIDVEQVYHLLASRAEQGLNEMRRFDWTLIENMNAQEVAATLQESLIFVFLSMYEGFGRLPLEAMLCGSLVVAYDVAPINEYLSTQNAFLAPRGDVISLVDQIEAITRDFPEHIETLQTKSEMAAAKAATYSPENEISSVLMAWEQIFSAHAA